MSVALDWSPAQQAAIDRVRSWLADPTVGVREPNVFRLFGHAGSGKALAFDQDVQTPSGPRPIAVLRVGDEVFGADGRATRVTGVFPQGPRQAYRVTFRDGASVECDEAHLWSVWTSKLRATGRPTVVRTLGELMRSGLRYAGEISKFYVPLCAPLEYAPRSYLVAPYTLGALIGDGTFTSTPTLCLPDEKSGVLERVRSELPEWGYVSTGRQVHCNYHRILDRRGGPKKPNGVMIEMRRLGLAVKSPERFIPVEYLQGSVEQRWALLRGLMDTDGSCRVNRTSYSTMSERLADDVCRLVQSLGGTAIKARHDRSEKGIEFHINVKTFEMPFACHARKVAAWRPSAKNPPSRAIIAIKPTRICEHVCIKVDADDGLFLTKDHVVTHNTSLALALSAGVAGQVRFAAFTGKAALVMQQKGCPGATTIHRLIYLPRIKCQKHLLELAESLRAEPDADRRRELQVEHDLEKANLARPTFTLNVNSPLRDASLLVIDECSMCPAPMGADLLSFGVPILAIGDPAQLPPVKDRGYFTDPRQQPDLLLTEIHRQAAGSPVLMLATLARSGEPLPYGQHGESRVVHRKDLSIAQAVEEHDQIICGRNATRRAINARAREHLGLRGPLPLPGDRLVCRRNDYETGLLNGSLWTVDAAEELDSERCLLSVTDGSLSLTVEAHRAPFEGREVPYYERRDAQLFEFGFAITCHLSQGSQWRSVCIVDESDAFGADARRWAYTAITRASDRVTVVR